MEQFLEQFVIVMEQFVMEQFVMEQFVMEQFVLERCVSFKEGSPFVWLILFLCCCFVCFFVW